MPFAKIRILQQARFTFFFWCRWWKACNRNCSA